MSEWTSLHEIMKDLSVAQGCNVPASLETFNNTEPPVLNIEEENVAKEYFKSCEEGFTKPPDLNLIQEMLSMVTNKGETQDLIHTSNLNPLSPEFVPQPKNKSNKKQKKVGRNVAMRSIIEAKANELPIKDPDPSKPLLTPMNMFKKKSAQQQHKEKHIADTAIWHKYTKQCQYTPSMLASQYYNKYLANSKLKQQIQEDIWSRTEQLMKETDDRQHERVSSCSSSRDFGDDVSVKSSNTSFSSGMDFVSMRYHRHLILNKIEDCVVCAVAAKHGYSFKEEIS